MKLTGLAATLLLSGYVQVSAVNETSKLYSEQHLAVNDTLTTRSGGPSGPPIGGTTGISDVEKESFLINVVNKNLAIKSDIQLIGVRIYNTSGIMMHYSGVFEQTQKYNKQLTIPSGAYIVQVTLYDGTTQTQKVFIK